MISNRIKAPIVTIDDCGHNDWAKMYIELRQEPTANESAGNRANEMADQPEVGASYDFDLSGNEANNDYDQQAFTRHVNLRLRWIY